MDNKKIEDLLKSSKPKVEIDNRHKEGLRRDLLNSNKFGKQPGVIFTKNKVILALSLAIAIIIVISNPGFEEKEISAAELVDKVKANYAGFNIADQLNIVNSDLKIYGVNNEEIELDVTRKINFFKDQQRLTLLIKSTCEVLDDYIITGKNLYRTKEPKIDFQFNVPGDDISSIVTSFNCAYSTDSASSTGVIVERIENCDSYIIYKSKSNNPELGSNKEYKLKVDEEVDIVQYLRDNPVNIAGTLTPGNIKKINVNHDNDLVTIEVEKDIKPKEYKIYIKDLATGTENQEDSSMSFFFEINHANVDSLVSAEIEQKNVTKIQTVTVVSETGEIVHVKYEISRKGEVKKLSEQSFNEIKQSSKSASEFDINKNGFEYSYKIK
ncbi:MAG: hypothetical protein PVH88_20475 [Ignavibacteria bacterium]|jgi:hypothetical protein